MLDRFLRPQEANAESLLGENRFLADRAAAFNPPDSTPILIEKTAR
jgi:hypothetical protein